MSNLFSEAIAFMAARTAYPESGVTVADLSKDKEAEMNEARKEYEEVFDSIKSDEIREALDEAVGSYLAATIDYYCRLGVKQGIRFTLNMLMEGNENDYSA